MSEITAEDVEQAEASLLASKADQHKSKKAKAAYKAQAHVVAEVRRAWREQEIAAGRRGPGVSVVTEQEG